jgi:DNA-binding XRE family transcriptional regulator
MAISLKAARINADMTQAQAAKALGISKNTLSNYEKYITSPSIEASKRIAELYGFETDAIKWAQD